MQKKKMKEESTGQEPDCESCEVSGGVESPPRLTYEEKVRILSRRVASKGPNAHLRISSFGTSSRNSLPLPSLKREKKKKKDKEKNEEEEEEVEDIDEYHSVERSVEDWRARGELGEMTKRINVVDSFGKLTKMPGPLDYRPRTEMRSTQRSDPHWSFYDKRIYKSVDSLQTPGPGAYDCPPGIVPAEPYIIRQEKMKALQTMDSVGPGSYDVRRTAEMATQRFHRETNAYMAKRDNGSNTRETLDFNTLKVKVNKAKRNKKGKVYDEKSHLGPGAYFPLKDEAPHCICSSPESTLPPRRKVDYDPAAPTRTVHSIGVHRSNLTSEDKSLMPGPGEYDDAISMFGHQPLLEAGGAVSRPGKGTKSTTDSEGIVKGQHAHISFATRYIPKLPDMTTTINCSTKNGQKKTIRGKWVSSKPHASTYKSPYTAPAKKIQRIQRNVGRGTQSTVQNLPFHFSGKNSTGAYFKFHS